MGASFFFFFFDAEPAAGEPGMPSLDACALCAKPLGRDIDIFMYRGDTPFCSAECRYEQMQVDAVVRGRSAAGGRRQQHSSVAEATRRAHPGSAKVSVVS